MSALRVACDTVFQETALKRSVCLLPSWSRRQGDPCCCQELFGDDAQAACSWLLSQLIRQLLLRERDNTGEEQLSDNSALRFNYLSAQSLWRQSECGFHNLLLQVTCSCICQALHSYTCLGLRFLLGFFFLDNARLTRTGFRFTWRLFCWRRWQCSWDFGMTFILSPYEFK